MASSRRACNPHGGASQRASGPLPLVEVALREASAEALAAYRTQAHALAQDLLDMEAGTIHASTFRMMLDYDYGAPPAPGTPAEDAEDVESEAAALTARSWVGTHYAPLGTPHGVPLPFSPPSKRVPVVLCLTACPGWNSPPLPR